MRKFLLLMNFEWNRIYKLYTILILFVFVVQSASVIVSSKLYMKYTVEAGLQSGMSPAEIIESYEVFSFYDVIYSLGFLGPIAVGVVGIAFYIFFIWYRDWLGKNTFIYRLLMLPTSRMNVYFSKLATIMLAVFGLVALQFVFMFLYQEIVQWIVPSIYREHNSVIEAISSSYHLSIILPRHLGYFLLAYGLGMLFVILVFTFILFERSFHLLGIIAGLSYFSFCVVLFILPTIIQLLSFGGIYLYPVENLLLHSFIWLIITGSSLYLCRYLLKNKVTV